MDNSRTIEVQLRKRDSLFMLRVAGALVAGIILTPLAPLVLTFIVWIFLVWWKWRRPMHLGWIFAILTAICCLSFYRLEWLAQGGRLDDLETARGPKPEPGSPAATYGHLGMLGAVLAHERTPMSAFSEIFLIGPRLVIASWRKLLIHHKAHGADRKRIVEVLDLLTRLPSGAATDKLLAERETPDQLSRVLTYLLFFDWIGIARDGTKVWVLTEARRELRVPAPAVETA